MENKTHVSFTYNNEIIITNSKDDTFLLLTKNEIEDIFDELNEQEDDEAVITITTSSLKNLNSKEKKALKIIKNFTKTQ